VVGGRAFRVWELMPGRANEALDMRVYAYAALCGLLNAGLKLNRRADALAGGASLQDTPVVVGAPAWRPGAAPPPPPAPAAVLTAEAARAARIARMTVR
jgi:phage terminase large subunit GpA-like protein